MRLPDDARKLACEWDCCFDGWQYVINPRCPKHAGKDSAELDEEESEYEMH